MTAIAVLVLACGLAPAAARCEDDLSGLPEDAAPADLYWEVLRLQAAGLIGEMEIARVQRELDVIEAYYAIDQGRDELVRRTLVAALRRTYGADPGGENAPLHDAQGGRAYARRLHGAGVRAAESHSQRTLLIAGMLGVPTSKGELALIVALPAGGYLVGKVAALTYKKAALLLRKLRTPDEVFSHAGALGIRVDRVESKAGLERLIGRDAVAHIGSAPAAPEGITSAAKGGRNLPFKDVERLTEIDKTLDRIESAGPFPYKKDGTVFRNDKGILPNQPEGYFREYTVDTPGVPDRGMRRIVQGQRGEIYYTDDHYKSFVQIDPEVR
jgi:guanyl-specific ribonuclease Sa